MTIIKIQKTFPFTDLESIFEWLLHSENFTSSTFVFKSTWERDQYFVGAIRNVWTIAGWFQEEITHVEKNSLIRYKINRSFPKIKQEFSEIKFKTMNQTVVVTWTIEFVLQPPLFNKLFGKIGKFVSEQLYTNILNQLEKQLQKSI